MFKRYLSNIYIRASLIGLLLLFGGTAHADDFFKYSGQVPPSNSGGTPVSSAVQPLNATSVATLPNTPVALTAPTTVYCADAVNGNDANTGVASGTYPNYTNCKKHISNACTAMTVNSALFATGIFHDATVGTSAVVSGTNSLCTVPNALANTFASPGIITSFGPPLANDVYSGANISAWFDGGDCISKATGNCAGQTDLSANWTFVGTFNNINVYKQAFTQQPAAVYIDNIQTWPDGPNADGAVGLQAASCLSSPCPGNVTASSLNPQWIASHTYAANSVVQAQITNDNVSQWWFTSAGGTGSTTVPSCYGVNTCQAGTTTFTDGTITWVFEGGSQGKVGAAQSVQGSWYWDGQNIYMSTLANDSPANHVIEVADHYEGIIMNANGAGANNWIVSHIGIRNTIDGLLWRNNAAATCIDGDEFLYNIIQQTGEGNVDLSNFGNGFRTVGADTACTPVHATLFSHNAEYYNGDHGGQTTMQAGVNNMVVSYNHYVHGNHASVNGVGTGATTPTGVQVIGNFVDTDGPTANQSVANDSVLGIYFQNGGTEIISGNYIRNMFGSYCTAGFCACIDVQGVAGVTIENNTCDTALECLYTANTPTSVVYKGNACSNLQNYAGTAAAIITHTGEITGSDFNVLTSLANPVIVSGTAESLTTWQGTGNDTHSLNQNPVYNPTNAYPFQLNNASPGMGLTANQGLLGVNAGANQNVNGLTQ